MFVFFGRFEPKSTTLMLFRSAFLLFAGAFNAIVLSVFLFSISACDSKSKKTVLSHIITKTDTLNIDSLNYSNSTIYEFENQSSDSPVSFWFFKKGGVNYYNAETMLSSIIDSSMNEEAKAKAIWKFVAESGAYKVFPYDHKLQDNVDPLSLLTFPYFMCGEKAGILVNLASLAGFQSRSVGLDGHVVSEIRYANAWHMFDADQNCIFRNQKGQIASVEDIHKFPDLINKQNVEFALMENFYGYNHYKAYFENYKPSWIDTSSIILNYAMPSMLITLYPEDKVVFSLSATRWWSRLRSQRNKFNAKGILTRKVNPNRKNVSISSNTIRLQEQFPYYVKELRVIASNYSEAKVYFETQNRKSHKTEKIYLGSFKNTLSLTHAFSAPSGPDIYYSYSVIFENLKPADLPRISVAHEFEFNAITFPFQKIGTDVIETDSLAKHQLLFKIMQ